MFQRSQTLFAAFRLTMAFRLPALRPTVPRRLIRLKGLYARALPPCRQVIARTVRRRIPSSPRLHHANRLQRRRRVLRYLRRKRQNLPR